jgi:hypothetical protein
LTAADLRAPKLEPGKNVEQARSSLTKNKAPCGAVFFYLAVGVVTRKSVSGLFPKNSEFCREFHDFSLLEVIDTRTNRAFDQIFGATMLQSA